MRQHLLSLLLPIVLPVRKWTVGISSDLEARTLDPNHMSLLVISFVALKILFILFVSSKWGY